jgi:hypothetical protein
LKPAKISQSGCYAGFVALLLSTAAGVTIASAASLTNRDEREHKLVIVEGDKKIEHTLKPQQALENICAKGCIIRLNDSDDDEYELEVNDVVSIEDGSLYYDSPDPSSEQGTPSGQTPPAKK